MFHVERILYERGGVCSRKAQRSAAYALPSVGWNSNMQAVHLYLHGFALHNFYCFCVGAGAHARTLATRLRWCCQYYYLFHKKPPPFALRWCGTLECMAAHNETGKRGEDIALLFLVEHGFALIERNYQRTCGEIDLVMRRQGRVHFIEVKAVSYETKQALHTNVSRGTFRPEHHVHRKKKQRLGRIIAHWVLVHGYEGEYQCDIASVRMVPQETYATVEMIEAVALWG